MEKPCMECGKAIICKPSHFARTVYCSKSCMAKGYKKRMVGLGNPNYKDAGLKDCKTCGIRFISYNKSRKYCSHKCAGSSPESLLRLRIASLVKRKPREKKGRRCTCIICGTNFLSKYKTKYCSDHKANAREAQSFYFKTKVYISKKIHGVCLNCGIDILSKPSSIKKYCSYACHIKSGGAIRAGKAACSMTRKYGAKKDANHTEIVNAFKSMGASVMDMSTLGSGVPDLIVFCKNKTHLVDIKNPNTAYGRRGLNPLQKEWASKWQGGPVYLISTVEQVAEMVNGNLVSLKRFPEL